MSLRICESIFYGTLVSVGACAVFKMCSNWNKADPSKFIDELSVVEKTQSAVLSSPFSSNRLKNEGSLYSKAGKFYWQTTRYPLESPYTLCCPNDPDCNFFATRREGEIVILESGEILAFQDIESVGDYLASRPSVLFIGRYEASCGMITELFGSCSNSHSIELDKAKKIISELYGVQIGQQDGNTVNSSLDDSKEEMRMPSRKRLAEILSKVTFVSQGLRTREITSRIAWLLK